MITAKNNSMVAAEDSLQEVLGNFRASVHAWSDAAYNRPRHIVAVEHGTSWRPAAAWALGCVLEVSSAAGGLYDLHYHRQQAALQAARQQQLAAEQSRSRQTDETLFEAVDSDVSRQVPSAMEPLAQLMDENTSR